MRMLLAVFGNQTDTSFRRTQVIKIIRGSVSKENLEEDEYTYVS